MGSYCLLPQKGEHNKLKAQFKQKEIREGQISILYNIINSH